MQITMVSTFGEKCGVNEYTLSLLSSLFNQGLVSDVQNIRCSELDSALENQGRLLHVQYVPALYNLEHLRSVLVKYKGPKLITAHHFDSFIADLEKDKVIDAVIIHDTKYLDKSKKRYYLVQGCPVFEKQDKFALRKELNLPTFAKIIVSFGFIMRWKSLGFVFNQVAPYLALDKNIFLLLLHSYHEHDNEEGFRIEQQFQETIAKYQLGAHVFTSHDYLEKDAINKFLQASDLGILFAPIPIESHGSSAAMKEFISARCPVVCTDIRHYADIESGVVKVPLGDIKPFIYKMLDTLYDEDVLLNLTEQQENNYQVYNYDIIARQHAEIYRLNIED